MPHDGVSMKNIQEPRYVHSSSGMLSLSLSYHTLSYLTVPYLVVGRGEQNTSLVAEAAGIYSLLVSLDPPHDRARADVPQKGRLVLAARHEARVIAQHGNVQYFVPCQVKSGQVRSTEVK